MHEISRLKAWEVRSLYLQTMLDLDLKRKSYSRLKMTVQTMSGNVAPPFRYCWTHFWRTSSSSNYAYHISFQILGSQESISSNGTWFGFETKKLWLFEDDCANHERKCRTSISQLLDTFLKHFLGLKLCILYLVSKLEKLGIQIFKRYSIWS